MKFDLIIRNGLIVDGRQTPRYAGDVGIRKDRIAAIGDLRTATAPTVIDAQENVSAPGFIDVHTHSDALLLATPHLTAKTMQGFTTEFLMLDGISYAPVNRHTVREWIQYLRSLDGLPFEAYSGWESIADYMALLDGRTAQNVATFVPYANVRTLAMGFGEQTPNDYQLSDVQRQVAQGMAEGACGLSTGLDYADECYATTDELVAACLGMAPTNGVYVTHVRYARGTLAGVKEAVEIGRRAGVPVHISHLKGLTPAETAAIIDYIDLVAINEVDFSFDVYPYQSSSTMLQYLLPPEIWHDGILAAYGKLSDPVLRERFQRRLDAMNLAEITLAWLPSRRNADYQGVSLAKYVAATGRRPADALCDLLIEEGMAVLLVFHQEETGLETAFLEHPCYMMGSDGIYFADGAIHPRHFGSAARLLGHYVRRKRSLTLEAAVYKLSGYPAQRFKLRDRGMLRVGAYADVVVFDPDTIADRATFDHPYRPAQGVSHVVVNGTLILADRVPVTGALPGRYLRYNR